MSTAFLAAWLRAFVVTQVVEVPIYRFGPRVSLGLALALSAVTHPIVWFVYFGPIGERTETSYEARIVAAELFAWLVEAGLLSRVVSPRRALLWAFVANAASVLVGVTLRALTGYP